MSEKITVLLRAVGDAPILKQKKFTVDPNNDIAWFSLAIRKMIQLADDQSIFFYISQTFSPSPDHTFQALHDCYSVSKSEGTDSHLVMHYSTTPAWG